MKVLAIDPGNPDPAAIGAAVGILRKGGVLIYPTDTCYGLGADPRNKRAVQRLSAMKQRDESKKFSVITKDLDQIGSITILKDAQRAVLERYLPGPFTFVLLAANLQLFGSNTIGVRIPDHPVTRQIADAFDGPFISTSANLGGHPAIYSYQDIQEDFLHLIDHDNLPDLVLDAGVLPQNPPSTVVDLVKQPPVVIRQGAAEFRWPLEA